MAYIQLYLLYWLLLPGLRKCDISVHRVMSHYFAIIVHFSLSQYVTIFFIISPSLAAFQKMDVIMQEYQVRIFHIHVYSLSYFHTNNVSSNH